MKLDNRSALFLDRFLFAVILASLLLAGCDTATNKPLNIIPVSGETEEETAVPESGESERERQVHWIQQPERSDLLVSPETGEPPVPYLMNFEDIPLNRFIDVMMTDVFKLNYMVTGPVRTLKNPITIKMTEDISREKAFRLFEKIIGLYNVVIDVQEKVYFFKKAQAPRNSLSGTFVYGRDVPESGRLDPTDEVTFLVPFYSIPAGTLVPIIGKYLPPQALVIPVEGVNILLINGTLEQIAAALPLINLLDRPQFKNRSIVMVTPKFWGIQDFAVKVKELLNAEDIPVKSDAQSRGIVLIPIESLNSLMVISPVDSWADRVLHWLNELDIPAAAGEARKVYHYKLRNIKVDSIVDVLTAYERSMELEKDAEAAARRTPPVGAEESSSRIIAVKETNAVVIIATPVEYQRFMNIIRRVDVPRNQVFVEVIVGEVSVDESSELGLEFWINRYLHGTEFGTKGGLGVYREESGTPVLPGGSNAFIKGVLPGTQYEVLLNALISDSVIDIISTPKITVLENEEAEILVGSDVPVISSESGYPLNQSEPDSAGGRTYFPFRSVNYISTGIILKVKPAILSNNNISLEISQEISEAQENTISEISSPEILKRTIKTTLVVQQGQIAFLGGLIQKRKTEGKSGIPVLSKIPLLGLLFKKTARSERKTELVVFINAKVIRKNSEMKEIVEGIKRIVTRGEFLEEE